VEEEDELRQQLSVLQAEHRALDQDVNLLQQSANVDALALARLKKRKLALKDRIAFIEDLLNPDIIA